MQMVCASTQDTQHIMPRIKDNVNKKYRALPIVSRRSHSLQQPTIPHPKRVHQIGRIGFGLPNSLITLHYLLGYLHEPLPVGQEAFIPDASTSSKLLILPRLARATVRNDLEEEQCDYLLGYRRPGSRNYVSEPGLRLDAHCSRFWGFFSFSFVGGGGCFSHVMKRMLTLGLTPVQQNLILQPAKAPHRQPPRSKA